jgi:hypothetical protein
VIEISLVLGVWDLVRNGGALISSYLPQMIAAIMISEPRGL